MRSLLSLLAPAPRGHTPSRVQTPEPRPAPPAPATAMSRTRHDTAPESVPYAAFAELAEAYPRREVTCERTALGWVYTVWVHEPLRRSIVVWSLTALRHVLEDLERPAPARVRPYLLALERRRAEEERVEMERLTRELAAVAREAVSR